MIKKIFRRLVAEILTLESKVVLAKYRPKIIAVTGSVGKTSTKDAVAAVLESRFKIRKSEKSFNSDIGIPLTILGCGNAWNNPLLWIYNILEGLSLIIFPHHTFPSWLIVEVGADRPGDIKSAVEWIKPDIAIVTHVGELPVHVEFFPTPEAVAAEKANLAKAVPSTGLVILNADDPIVLKMRDGLRPRVLTYGFNESADLRLSNLRFTYVDGMVRGIEFDETYDKKETVVKVNGVVGDHYAYSAAAAMLVGYEHTLNAEEMCVALARHTPPPGRSRIIEGVCGTLIIDDTYNSSPAALDNALKSLTKIETTGRKIAILGDMMELGKFTIDAHEEAGKHAAKVCDILYAVGQRAKFIAEGAIGAGMAKENVFLFEESGAAGRDIQYKLKKGDCILIKGSQYVRMERATEEIMAHPEMKGALLVRQEKEWSRR